jgi:hypothetical protein
MVESSITGQNKRKKLKTMSIDYHLHVSSVLYLDTLMNDIKTEFGLEKPDHIPNILNDGDSLYVYFIEYDEEDKADYKIKFGMSLNGYITFSFRTNEGEHNKRQKLICQIIVYILKKINGDVFFSYQNYVAYLERRSGVLAITPETFKYFPELEGMIDSPYIIKTLQIMELPDDDIDYED